jgi:hypothetical protein
MCDFAELKIYEIERTSPRVDEKVEFMSRIGGLVQFCLDRGNDPGAPGTGVARRVQNAHPKHLAEAMLAVDRHGNHCAVRDGVLPVGMPGFLTQARSPNGRFNRTILRFRTTANVTQSR